MLKEKQMMNYATRIEEYPMGGERFIALLEILKVEQRSNYTIEQVLKIVETADRNTVSKLATWCLQFPDDQRFSKVLDKLTEVNGYYEQSLAKHICDKARDLETNGRGKSCKPAFA